MKSNKNNDNDDIDSDCDASNESDEAFSHDLITSIMTPDSIQTISEKIKPGFFFKKKNLKFLFFIVQTRHFDKIVFQNSNYNVEELFHAAKLFRTMSLCFFRN